MRAFRYYEHEVLGYGFGWEYSRMKCLLQEFRIMYLKQCIHFGCEIQRGRVTASMYLCMSKELTVRGGCVLSRELAHGKRGLCALM